jgi:hypothetical protein
MKKPLPKLLKEAQKYFNAYIRKRDSTKGCISCGGKVDHAGHYFNQGQHSALRFDEANVHGQCISCNCYKHGNLIEYGLGIINRYGPMYHLDLLAKSRGNKVKKWSRDELESLINKYK